MLVILGSLVEELASSFATLFWLVSFATSSLEAKRRLKAQSRLIDLHRSLQLVELMLLERSLHRATLVPSQSYLKLVPFRLSPFHPTIRPRLHRLPKENRANQRCSNR